MIGCLSLGRETFDVNFANEKISLVEKRLNKLSYNINGSGNSRGTAMVDTKLDGSGNYQTRQVGLDDYRSQEFPNGSAQTINTYTFKITHV